MKKLQAAAVLPILFLLLILCFLGSFLLGRYPVPLKELLGILADGLPLIELEPFWTEAQAVAVLNIRLPRILLAILVGAGLSAAGAAYQGVFQNPMAAPDLLGASAGAGFGAALAIFIGLSGTGVTISAFAVSILTVVLVFLISKYTTGERITGLILAGIMVSSLFQAGTSFLKLAADPTDKLPAITYWLMGSLSGVTMDEVIFALRPMLLGLIPLFLLRWRLSVLTMGDEEARALGVDPGKMRLITVLCATLVTAAAVSVSGMIGWVGLVIPHMMRRLMGSDYRYLMPASMLGGGLFLLLVDDFARNMFSAQLPIGILTAFLGVPVFLLMVFKRR